MEDANINDLPQIHAALIKKCEEIGFSMPSDLFVGTLLKTLIASKPKSLFLELGTGIGLSLSWMLDGMDQESRLISVDNDPELIDIAQTFFGHEKRLKLICADGNKWINNYKSTKFDLIFADAWPGKYSLIDETLDLLNIGGIYLIDDMLPQPNWPAGHQQNADQLIEYLENRKDFSITKMNWSTGIVIATKLY